jgi:uncharacterized protein (DUF1501 family)
MTATTKPSRRTLLKSGLAAALPALFARAAWAGAKSERVLVLVQLDGGNDGLNTVVPYSDAAYFNARPGIRIPEKNVLRIDDRIGLHPNLTGLKAAFDDGALAVVQGVGYPNPNRSHFASTDIWHTASTELPARWSGWAGRALDRCATGDVAGLHLDPGPLSLALVGERVTVPSIADAQRFRVRGGRRELLDRLARGEREGDTLEYIRKAARQAYRTSERVEQALQRGRARDDYPQTALAQRLWQIARMIEARMESRVFAVRLAGFDTHARQRAAHDTLMRQLGDALGAFHGDLVKSKLADRVLVVTYSEFGRRVEENRSLGTDHGAAAPMFAMGGALRAGVHGEHPALTDLVDGDLRFHTDFRQVYATILERWLAVDPTEVLGRRYAPVAFL